MEVCFYERNQAMNYYLAPMEGITGYVYRNAYAACWRPMDKYFTPFLAPKRGSGLSTRERNDVLPEHNEGLPVVPQILTNRAEDFIATAKVLKEYGYREVNLNLGCPSGTVTAKGKGAGFLEFTEALNIFLEEISSEMTAMGMELSVKTRLGIGFEEEFGPLLEIFNQYPLKELIVHPRVLTDYYKNTPRMEAFALAMKVSKCPVCYNGDIFTPEAGRAVRERFPELERMMLGRGILKNPGLTALLEGELPAENFKARLMEFHQRIYDGYRAVMPGDRAVLFKMKELWSYLICLFEEAGPCMKQIRKAQSAGQYEAAVRLLFARYTPKDTP